MALIENIEPELSNLLQIEFTNEDQKQFMTNFQLYLIYGNDPNKFVVDLDNVWEFIGFSLKGNAKKILQKHFEINTDYIVQKALVTLAKQPQNGGQNKEIILMNVSTFKGLCMLSNTTRGKQTRLYYSKMETIFFKYLENKNKAIIETLQLEFKKSSELEKQKNLLAAYKDTPCVYIIKVSEENENTFIIRLGETDNIENRIKAHHQDFKDCVLIDVFACNRPHKFEQYILNRPDTKVHRLPSSELISISLDFTYSNLIEIIKKHIDFFDNTPFDKKLEYANVKFQESQSKERTELLKLITSTEDPTTKQQLMDLLIDKYNETTPIQDNDVIETTDKETESNRKVYKFSITDLKIPIAVYNSLREASRSLNDIKIHDYHIRTACTENTIQSNFRWFYVDEPDKLPEEIPPTKEDHEKQSKRNGLVAQINSEKTKIINVYPNQNIAINILNLAKCAITLAIKNKRRTGGFYWEMYNDCSEELKQTFDGELPEPQLSSTCSKKIQKIDPDTHNVIETYNCIQDVCNLYKICHKTIHKVSKSGDIYKNFIWKLV